MSDRRSSVYHPRLRTQLGRGTPVPGRTAGSRDCGVRTVQMGIDALTSGELILEVDEIRRRMGKPGPVPTSTRDAERCVDSLDAELAAFDRRPLRYDRHTGELFRPLLDDAVRQGEPVQLAINYGTFNDLMRAEGRRTGDPAFRGGHSVLVHGWRVEQGATLWQDFDPLNDGRRRLIPEGERWIPRRILVAAWRRVDELPGGGSGCFFGIFRGGERTL